MVCKYFQKQQSCRHDLPNNKITFFECVDAMLQFSNPVNLRFLVLEVCKVELSFVFYALATAWNFQIGYLFGHNPTVGQTCKILFFQITGDVKKVGSPIRDLFCLTRLYM